MDVNDDELAEIYHCMVRCRVMDERMTEIRIARGGKWHPSKGCEAAIVGSFWGLRDDDVLSPHYRHYACGMLARGLPMDVALAQFMGKRPDARRWADHGMMPRVAGSEGSYIPISAGVALAASIRGKDNVVVAGCGDGSTGLGDFHEGINLAAVLDLPFVLVAVNNGVYMHVPIERFLRTGDIAGMASSYGISGVAVDGNDIFAVREAVQVAVQRARAGGGPTLVECRTFRMTGHWEPDPVDTDRYWPRWKRDLEIWKARDPLGLAERVLLERGIYTDKQLAEIRAGVESEFTEAYAAAESMPPMDREEVAGMERNIFVGGN